MFKGRMHNSEYIRVSSLRLQWIPAWKTDVKADRAQPIYVHRVGNVGGTIAQGKPHKSRNYVCLTLRMGNETHLRRSHWQRFHSKGEYFRNPITYSSIFIIYVGWSFGWLNIFPSNLDSVSAIWVPVRISEFAEAPSEWVNGTWTDIKAKWIRIFVLFPVY